MSDRRLLQIQAVSGLLFLAFLVLHLVNTAWAAGGAVAYDEFQLASRAIYQHPLIEIVLVLLPLAVHFAAAITRLRRSGFRRQDVSLRARLHRYTGYTMLLVIVGHVLAVRGSSFFFDVYPGFAGLSYSLWWQPALFYPYYVIFSLSALSHGLNGACLALDVFGRPLPAGLARGWGFWTPVVLGAAALMVAIVTIVTMGGQRGAIADPTDNDYARLMNELVGAELTRDDP